MGNNQIVLIDGARTAIAKFGESFRDVSAIELGAASAREALIRSRIEPEEVGEVVFGNVLQSSVDAHLIARHVGLKAGIPIEVPALTVNRLCGSGLQSIITAAKSILIGESQVALAGGAENMSQVPHVIRGARWGLPLGKAAMEDLLWDSFNDPIAGCNMAGTAENVAEKYGITREKADEHALMSNMRALAAGEKGYLAEEIIPIVVKNKKGEKIVDADEHPRMTSLEALSQLTARFKKDGVVTAGNASGINDGAAAVIIASSSYAEKRNLKPLARLVSWGIVGVEPRLMGIGPVGAIRQALAKAGMSIQDLDLIEINEAFSTQYLACQKLLDFDPEIGNVNGGAVALGHPLAASGARITLSLVYELRRRGKKYGASSLCIGGGQGIAAIWERL